jgi:hypothetical protein
VPTVSGFAKKTSSTTLSTTLTKVGEAKITLAQASVIDVNANLTIEAEQFQTVTCVDRIEGTQISNEVRDSITQTIGSGEQQDNVSAMDVVGSSIYRGAGNETYAEGEHTVEVFCKTTEGQHTFAVVSNVATLAWTSAT